ncbi:damage-inducible protein [Massilia eurypsychrophila]|uniref:Damage-inducible protein n=1 Tax=Massilia eurypsychrophila TaxID=1485217 RepID=A0A2G8T9I0_9BURK|nr:type ISP restriction/modification enzyme [Massilia eurypsychrophila]PIL42633.1 damage-inducible protein [Massilia eurypsychrophila]
MTALFDLLATYRSASVSEREKGTYFEELIVTYLRNEATYRDLYSQIWTYGNWASEQGIDGRDTGIDLVAKTQGTGEFHAIQCKFFAEDYKVQKADIDSFFTASGKKPFVRRIVITTTNNWSEHANDALQNQQPPVNKIDLHDLETSQIDWAKYQPHHAPILMEKKKLRDHQKTALSAVQQGLETADRGKLIMACGTGKTFTSLKIAESVAGPGKRVLFLVPSLALLSQTLTEWTQESDTPLHSFAVCSDSDVGKKRAVDEDVVQTFAHELRYPATTQPGRLAMEMAKRHDAEHMSVVFSTYHSIDVISNAQKEHQLGDFDLIVCDEAHRTTGATFDDADESNFVKIHNADFIRSSKRLYMTATPRIYGDNAKASAEKDNVALCSMDDEALFGKELFVITFSQAVQRGLLVDYKVIVLAVDESHVNRRLQALLADENNQVKVDDAAKIIGCWKALGKQGTQEDLAGDTDPMRRAVAFCQVIDVPKNAKTHKTSSKNIAGMFQAVVEAYQAEEEFETVNRLICEAEHVDGRMNASQKEEKLNWLKAQASEHTCRILSNVRCLSEGVDVPALDAVLFLTPRNSQVDVVQSVGRVMRNAPGKKRGYVILPVVIPAGMEAHEALNDNKTYKVVWQVLQALRSHDDRFDAMVNKLDLIGRDTAKMEVVAVTDKINKPAGKNGAAKKDAGKGQFNIGEHAKRGDKDKQIKLEFEIGEIERAIYAKVVQKCGNRHHWEDWANDIAKIARTHIDRIQAILEDESHVAERAAFGAFAAELRDDLNDSISDNEVVEMLAQHLITKPVFDALFSDYSFAQHNPMSLAMQSVLDVLQEHHLNKEADTLQRFYDSVKLRAEGIQNAEGKQKIVVELYNNFFQKAFPRLKEKLGIVYTPVEVVDFIIHSVNDILQSEFGQTLASDNVHIIDPFTGTGTFITRLMQSGLISKESLPKKYAGQIHANEIILLAYYIAAINIESVYHDIVGGEYQPFSGICLTDTFQLYEKEDLVDQILVQNSARRKRQKNLDIRVIIGNPPYSSGQEDAGGDNKNISYPHLDERILDSYVNSSSKKDGKSKAYDSYIRAIRWASDRIGNSGVIGFVTNAGFLEANTADGLRKCLAEEFSSLYVFHLRGNARTSGEQRRKEKDNVFGQGTRTPIAITLFVKNPNAKQHGQIFWHDIGDYLSEQEKLNIIKEYKSVGRIHAANGWLPITPNEHHDWLGQRDIGFSKFIQVGEKKDKDSSKIFETYSMGVKTNRDDWVFNSSKHILKTNMTKLIHFYNEEVDRWSSEKMKKADTNAASFINSDPTKIKWTEDLIGDLAKQRKHEFEQKYIRKSLRRPFCKQFIYYDKNFNWTHHLMPRMFPNEADENVMIYITGTGVAKDFSALAINLLPDFQLMANGQGFPLYLYDTAKPCAEMNQKNTQQIDIFSTNLDLEEVNIAQKLHIARREGISKAGLSHFSTAYPDETISRESLFYYIYGLLHSPDYRERYADNLSKELPRIPCVKTASDFWAFSKAGRKLADLHINYESVPCYPVQFVGSTSLLDRLEDTDFQVMQMKFAKKKDGGKNVDDKSIVLYNHKITITGIPLEAYEYEVNGKPALEWVMERQSITTRKDSGIINDANDWATETMDNSRYPLELFQRVITVSLETMKIVRSLPKLDILVADSVAF